MLGIRMSSVCSAGRAFEFMGEVGKHYNLISEQTHQLTMRLKLGQMFDHNGTYMDVSAPWPCNCLICPCAHQLYTYIQGPLSILLINSNFAQPTAMLCRIQICKQAGCNHK